MVTLWTKFFKNGGNTKAAKSLLTRLLSLQGVTPKRIVTDKLGSYGVAKRKVIPTVEHRSHKSLNNHAENSHLPLRKRERAMQKFKSPGLLQRFLTTFSGLRNLSAPSPPTFCNRHSPSSNQRFLTMETGCNASHLNASAENECSQLQVKLIAPKKQLDEMNTPLRPRSEAY